MASLEQLLGYTSLTGVIQAVKSGIPDNLPPAFFARPRRVEGNAGRYTQVRGSRAVASVAQYGSSAHKRALKGLEVKDVKLLHSYEHIEMEPLVLQTLRNYDNYDQQQLGVQEVDRQEAEFRVRFDNLRLTAVYSMLANGKIWVDVNGNVLPSSSNAHYTIDFGISANNMNQLNGLIGASWATATTNIPAQIIALRIRSAQLTGYPLKYAFYGSNIASYLTQNDYVKDYLSRNPTFAQRFLEQAEIPDGLFGLTWIPIYTSFYEDADGNLQSFFGADSVAFTPEIDATVYEFLEGTYFVPGSFAASANMGQAINSMQKVQGMFSYAVPIYNPPTVQLFAGDTFLALWKVVDALFISDTTP